MNMSVWSLACRQSVFHWYHSEKHLSEFYPQDGGESQLALKLRHCHPMYWPLQQPVAGLLLWVLQAGDIVQLLQQATAHSSTAVGSKCWQCHVVSCRRKLVLSFVCLFPLFRRTVIGYIWCRVYMGKTRSLLTSCSQRLHWKSTVCIS